jgi:hypothetical protein
MQREGGDGTKKEVKRNQMILLIIWLFQMKTGLHN